MRESDLQAKCINNAKKALKGVVVARSATEGFPDRTFIYKTRVVCVEFKKKGKQPTELQRHMHQALWKNGIDTAVIDNESDFDWVIQHLQIKFVDGDTFERIFHTPDKLAGETFDL